MSDEGTMGSSSEEEKFLLKVASFSTQRSRPTSSLFRPDSVSSIASMEDEVRCKYTHLKIEKQYLVRNVQTLQQCEVAGMPTWKYDLKITLKKAVVALGFKKRSVVILLCSLEKKLFVLEAFRRECVSKSFWNCQLFSKLHKRVMTERFLKHSANTAFFQSYS